MEANNYNNGFESKITKRKNADGYGCYVESAQQKAMTKINNSTGQIRKDRDLTLKSTSRTPGISSSQTSKKPSRDEGKNEIRSSALQKKRKKLSVKILSRKHKRRKKANFKKYVIAYLAFIAIVLFIGAVLFYSYLGSYENSRPYVTASSIVKSFLSADELDKFLKTNMDKLDVNGDMDSLFLSYEANVVGKQVSYVQNSAYRFDAPSYDIIADGQTIAQVVLEHKGSKGWGFSGWEINRMNIGQYMPDMTKYMVIVPHDSTVYLDGELLDTLYITDTGTPKVLRNVVSFLDKVPTYDTYMISSMTLPAITAKDVSGEDISFTISDTTLSATSTSQEFIDEMMPNTEATLECYAKYFIYESHNLSAYMLPGTQFYIATFGDDGTYGFDPSMYNYEYISDYGFTEKEITNFVKYTDDCYTVDVKYQMFVNFTDEKFSDNDQKMDATWVFVYDDNKNDWFLADCQYH